ncbi:MAG: hypothetical protein ACOCQR_02515 [bacterium]
MKINILRLKGPSGDFVKLVGEKTHEWIFDEKVYTPCPLYIAKGMWEENKDTLLHDFVDFDDFQKNFGVPILTGDFISDKALCVQPIASFRTIQAAIEYLEEHNMELNWITEIPLDYVN